MHRPGELKMQMLQELVDSGRQAQLSGSWAEAVSHYEGALSLLHSAEDVRERAELLRRVGTVHAERGELDDASAAFHASRIAAGCARAPAEEAAAHIGLGNVELLRGNLEEATKGFLKARELSERSGQEWRVAQIDRNLEAIANIQGSATVALLSYQSALERYRETGDEFTATRALNSIGMAQM